jgi:rubrerythrin
MARQYAPLTVNPALALKLRDIQTASVQDDDARQALGALLQSALQLEFATIPTYLSAAFSLVFHLNTNRKIYDLILRVAKEEMLHLTAVANLMNAIGIAPNIACAVPQFPCDLTVLDPPLRLDLRSFSLDLVKGLFMAIEAPEVRVVFPAAFMQDRPRTIGQFYKGIIEIIDNDTIPDLFKNASDEAYKQRAVDPNFSKAVAYLNNQDTGKYPLKLGIDFKITDKVSAIRHLSWVVNEGEGEAPYKPLDTEGLPGHHYRFESIVRSRYLVPDEHADLKYSFSGGDLPFDPSSVHEFDVNAKAKDYHDYPLVQQNMKSLNDDYTTMINSLHQAFNCPSPQQVKQADDAYDQAVGIMRNMSNRANTIIRQAQAAGIKGGIPFEYGGPVIA